MTILTRPSIVVKKPDSTKSPLVLENCLCDEDKVDIYPQPTAPEWSRKRSAGALLCMSLLAMLVAISGVTCGLMLYRHYLRSSNGIKHYQRFCSIPMVPVPADYKGDMLASDQLIEPNYRESRDLPVRWSSEPYVQVFSVGDETNDVLNNALREEFDIGSRVETIRVFDNGRTISFLHDFDDNVTGIVDTDRCFMMDLDPTVVVPPDMLVVGIENRDQWDISRVHSTLRAVLPAIQMLKAKLLAERCFDKPTYRLQKEEGVIIRKRSLDAPSHDYIQFAGRHVQEIEISNLADLLQHEQDAKAY